MIQFICDSCGKIKSPNQLWLLGLAAEAVAATAARREVTILADWDREHVVHPLAVHFCSPICKDRYLALLFDEDIIKKTSRRNRRQVGRQSWRRHKQLARRKPRRAA